uniref:Uncharacterized protein n=1 Tax=Arundo donax TaxID=35708 RepID=A0A0A9G089_ARUDO
MNLLDWFICHKPFQIVLTMTSDTNLSVCLKKSLGSLLTALRLENFIMGSQYNNNWCRSQT